MENVWDKVWDGLTGREVGGLVWFPLRSHILKKLWGTFWA